MAMLKGSDTLRLLIGCTASDRAELMVSALKNLGIPTRPTQAETVEDLLEHIEENPFDVLISSESPDEYSMDALLGSIRKLGRDIPVVIISDTFDTDTHTRALEAGAADALPSSEPHLIALVVRRELVNLQARRAQRRLEASLTEVETRNTFLLEHSSEAIAYLHDGMHIYVNRAYIELFGYSSREDLDGMPIIDLVDPHDLASFKNYLRSHGRKPDGSAFDNDGEELHFHGMRMDQSSFNAVMTLSPSSYEGEPCTQIIIRIDTGETHEVPTQDSTTGFGNRKLLEEHLPEAVTRAHARENIFALAYISIDRFNQFSIAYPLYGDVIAGDIAKKLVEVLDRKYLYRFADSTFIALIPGLDNTSVSPVLEKALQHIAEHIIVLEDGRNLRTTLSIGCVCFAETARRPDELLALAAAENSKVSEKNGNDLSLYDPAQDASSSSTAMMELLSSALAQNRFKLLFQSLVDVVSEGESFYEVYLRLPINEGQTLEPEQFLPAALQDRKERLALKIDRWVLLNACKRLKEHLKLEPRTRILINLSGESLLDTSLPEWIGKLARATSQQPGTLILQFQEQDVLNYLNQASQMAVNLQQVGCEMSISRFGLSIDPFSTLKKVQARYIKLDGSFTQDLASEDHIGVIKDLVSNLNALEKLVIVPYVESTATLSKLWTVGVRYLQGYFLGRPEEQLGTSERA